MPPLLNELELALELKMRGVMLEKRDVKRNRGTL